SQVRESLLGHPGPLALATAHLDKAGRAEFARLAAACANLHCSVTHSLYLALDELRELAHAGCTIEFDLYTWMFPLAGRPVNDFAGHVVTLMEEGHSVYLTSDAGRLETGNPYEFT